MREIKFRAWDIKRSEMNTNQRNLLGNMASYGDEGRYEGHIVMQYTGLKDKNGKEIYEGDILKMYFQGTTPNPVEVTSSVFFSQGTFTAMALNGEPLPLKDSIIVSNKARQ